MAVKQILTVLDPSIELDDMVLVDREDPRFKDLKDPARSSQYPDDKNTGVAYPFITIRSVTIEMEDLKFMRLNFQDLLPEISLTIADNQSRLTNIDFPLDGDIISVYIRPNDDDVQKSIRMDFDIQTVSRSGTTPVVYNFYGQLRVPRIFDEITEAKSLLTSFEALIEICDDLNLGFATNEDKTEDRMTWLIAKEDRLKWLENITNYSYKNDDSFFYSFIDHNYFFNFINIQECFSEDDELDESIITMMESSDVQQGFDKTSSVGPLFLSNSRSAQGSNQYISYYNPFTESGSKVQNNGYRRYVQFYDTDEDELIEEFIEPLITRGNEQKVLLRGRRDENFFQSNYKYKYMGRQSSGEDGNVHPNYLFARVLNHQNLEEIEKAGLTIELPILNTDILRMKRIPVIIYDSFNNEVKYSNQQRDQEKAEDPVNEDQVWVEQQEIRNEFLTGFYVCWSFEITWKPSERYKTRAKLLRREWPERGTTVGTVQQEPS